MIDAKVTENCLYFALIAILEMMKLIFEGGSGITPKG
jgi:hypothetical protein